MKLINRRPPKIELRGASDVRCWLKHWGRAERSQTHYRNGRQFGCHSAQGNRTDRREILGSLVDFMPLFPSAGGGRTTDRVTYIVEVGGLA